MTHDEAAYRWLVAVRDGTPITATVQRAAKRLPAPHHSFLQRLSSYATDPDYAHDPSELRAAVHACAVAGCAAWERSPEAFAASLEFARRALWVELVHEIDIYVTVNPLIQTGARKREDSRTKAKQRATKFATRHSEIVAAVDAELRARRGRSLHNAAVRASAKVLKPSGDRYTVRHIENVARKAGLRAYPQVIGTMPGKTAHTRRMTR